MRGRTSDLNFHVESVKWAVTPEHERKHQQAYDRKHEDMDGTKLLQANTNGSDQCKDRVAFRLAAHFLLSVRLTKKKPTDFQRHLDSSASCNYHS